MKDQSNLDFSTQVIHACQTPEKWAGATLAPIYQTASHEHPTAENLSDTFAGKTSDHIYMRLTNPTNRILEEKLTFLEKGKGNSPIWIRCGANTILISGQRNRHSIHISP